MAYIHAYTGSPTGGGTDGTLLSENTGATPLTTAYLDAAANEVGASIACALRCETNYATTGNTTITPTGASAAKWALSANGTDWGEYGAALTIGTSIGATNTLYYARAKATSDETPTNDTGVVLVIAATIVPA